MPATCRATCSPPVALPPQAQVLQLNGNRWQSWASVLLRQTVSSLGALASLQHLELASCRFVGAHMQQLDASLAALPALKGLGLPYCSLTELPPLQCLPRLLWLDLKGNNLWTLPQSLVAATACQQLDLSSSLEEEALSVFVFVVFANMTSLRGAERHCWQPPAAGDSLWAPKPCRADSRPGS